jgi:hypothetical protein
MPADSRYQKEDHLHPLDVTSASIVERNRNKHITTPPYQATLVRQSRGRATRTINPPMVRIRGLLAPKTGSVGIDYLGGLLETHDGASFVNNLRADNTET